MLLDVINPASLVAEPFGRHFAAQAFDQSLSCSADDTREFNLVDAFENDVVCLHGIRRSEWRPLYIIYIYIYREREREKEIEKNFNPLDRRRIQSIRNIKEKRNEKTFQGGLQVQLADQTVSMLLWRKRKKTRQDSRSGQQFKDENSE